MIRYITIISLIALVRTSLGSVSIGTVAITELVNNCTSEGLFQSSDVLKLKAPITNNEVAPALFRVVVRMRATNASGETVDANFTGPLLVSTLPTAQGFDDSYGLVINTPAIPDGGTYTVTARLGLHNQFLGAIGIPNNGSGMIEVDVEVYKYDTTGAAGFLASATTPITVYRRNPCGNSTSGTLVTDRVTYAVGDPVTIEWGAAGCDARPAFAEASAATVEVRRMSGVPSGDPVADFDAATPVASISTWNQYDMPDDGCVVDEGVSRTFCYNDQIGTVQSVSLYNTYTTQQADFNHYLIIRLPQGAGTASHPIREAQFNYVFVGDPLVPIEISSFTGTVRGLTVELRWVTLSEQENLGYRIYRKLLDEGEYRLLTGELIPGAGTTLQTHEYSYVDETVEAGVTYLYRLADVSTSGVEVRHEPITVTIPGPGEEPRLEEPVPHPVRGKAILWYAVPWGGRVRLAVYDVAGRQKRLLVDDERAPGWHTVQLDERLEARAYFLRLEAPRGSTSRRLVVAD